MEPPPNVVTLLFPNHPLRPREVDPDFAAEFDAARAEGLAVRLYSDRTLAVLPGGPGAVGPLMLRGWMMAEARYAELHAALVALGYRPLNGPAAYAEAHYLPLAYPKLVGHTPETVWSAGRDLDAAWSAYRPLAGGDAIVKDYVKSAKHRWAEACFLPAGTGRGRFGDILSALLDDRGDLFERGFVFRRFVPLAGRECRLFYLNGDLLLPPGPPVPASAVPADALATFGELARRFASRFMTLDTALTAAGEWTVIEVGDGGVSGLPNGLDPADFYAAVSRRTGL